MERSPVESNTEYDQNGAPIREWEYEGERIDFGFDNWIEIHGIPDAVYMKAMLSVPCVGVVYKAVLLFPRGSS